MPKLRPIVQDLARKHRLEGSAVDVLGIGNASQLPARRHLGRILDETVIQHGRSAPEIEGAQQSQTTEVESDQGLVIAVERTAQEIRAVGLPIVSQYIIK